MQHETCSTITNLVDLFQAELCFSKCSNEGVGMNRFSSMCSPLIFNSNGVCNITVELAMIGMTTSAQIDA